MPAKIIYERFLWFHKQVRAEKYPNARILAEQFELSPKTAQRDIAFMRDRLFSPLVYVPSRRGYAYEENAYELPAFWVNQDELAALFIASRLATTIPDRSLKSSFKSFLEQILSFRTLDTPFSLDELGDKISVKNIEYAGVDELIFQKIVDALFYGKTLSISYFSPHNNEVSQRVILPLHLLQYMGSWHVISHCTLRNGMRDFALSRIRSVKSCHKKIHPEFSSDAIKEYIRKNFGLLSKDTSIMAKKYYAHSIGGEPPDKWQPLEEHLENVAEMAQLFAESFDAGKWGYLAGLWHDLGKYSDEFQQRLGAGEGTDAHIETKPGRVDHSTAGAQHASNLLNDKGKILAYVIAGHHAGLPNGKANESSDIANRLRKTVYDYTAFQENLINVRTTLNNLPFSLDEKRFGFQLSFFIRMLFSCLVDADFLDTEAFIDSERSLWRKGYLNLSDMCNRLSSALNKLTACAKDTQINEHRGKILRNCLDAAESPQGLFSLTVPTGGGKTLSSLAFAMKHALKHGLERIIYVIPYTSIIEQNAAVFRDILGENAVLEHHSNFEPKEEDHRSRLAAENWDAPLIVTTNVQFFESLYSCKSSRCRKAHNIAKSVVILDEAQMLPVPLLRPCMEALRELSSAYKTSIVLCTATQPALSTNEHFKDGLDGVQEIIPDPAKLYNLFKRIHVEILPELPDDVLADRLVAHDQVLCIVNTRNHARVIFESIRDREGCYHLSALMCPAHRAQKFEEIRKALSSGLLCRVVSTQLIEAGVDIDFPVVYRCAAGIDSIAQAAGRCNREGKLAEGGKVYVFVPESGVPAGHFRRTAETAQVVMRHHDDILSLAAVEAYFRNLYWMNGENLDEHHILDDLNEGKRKGDFPFRIVDKKFTIIKDGMEPIIIPWNKDAEKIIQGLRYADYPASFARKAQRFTVQVAPRVLNDLERAGSVERLKNHYCVLINMDLYSDDLGLCPGDPTFYRPESLIA